MVDVEIRDLVNTGRAANRVVDHDLESAIAFGGLIDATMHGLTTGLDQR